MTKSCSSNTDELRRAFKMLTGKWKLEILFLLHQSDHRFGELKRSLPGITQHMLTSQLRELEADGLISRQVYAEVPPRVEYALMPATLGLTPVIEGLLSWCRENSPGSRYGKRQLNRKVNPPLGLQRQRRGDAASEDPSLVPLTRTVSAHDLSFNRIRRRVQL